MPELPEVETTRRGLAPRLIGRRLGKVEILDGRLRWPVDPELPRLLRRRELLSLERRAKVLLFRFHHGHLLSHLGMSGSWRLSPADEPRRKHDHVCIRCGKAGELRYHDPRRFGFLLWTAEDPALHPRLRDLGPEPLGPDFDAEELARRARGRRVAVKSFLMDSRVVVGVGNIYANEALHRAGIRPSRAAGRIRRVEWDRLVEAVREVLTEAIAEGGTTLRDFSGSAGEPGYFVQNLRVYDREGQICFRCGGEVRRTVVGQRASFHCPGCQR